MRAEACFLFVAAIRSDERWLTHCFLCSSPQNARPRRFNSLPYFP